MINSTSQESLQSYNSLYEQMVKKFFERIEIEYQEFLRNEAPENIDRYSNEDFQEILYKQRKRLRNTGKEDGYETENGFLIRVIEIFHQSEAAKAGKGITIARLFTKHMPELRENFADATKTDFSDEEIIERLAEYQALSDFIEKLRQHEQNLNPKDSTQKTQQTTLQWKKENQTEFIQLIYALYDAGYITNAEGKITQIVKEFAQVFNVKLSEHWISNLSKSYIERNADYMPEIFGELEKAFEKQRVAKAEKQHKNNK